MPPGGQPPRRCGPRQLESPPPWSRGETDGWTSRSSGYLCRYHSNSDHHCWYRFPFGPNTDVAVSFQLLVLDVDGTVTDSQHQVTPAAREAVRQVQDAGIQVLLATGRRYRDVLPIAAEL
ncbi:MAG: hypothetical protein EBS83_08645, partial [Planctomycetia bacterium]|nr:hypothetical protein [Planctomycetia bacterium]